MRARYGKLARLAVVGPIIEAFRTPASIPAMVIPIVNFNNNQHEENENLRVGAFFDGIVTIAAILSM